MNEKRLTASARELKNVRSLTVTAMLLAIAVVLGIFSIPVTPSVKVSLALLAIGLASALFGPVVGGIVGALADILQHFIRPTGPYFPGFTISGALAGILFGLFLYRRKITLPRVVIACSLVTIPVNLFLNTYWLKLLYGNAYLAMLPARAVKELVLLPIYVALLMLLLQITKGFRRDTSR